MYGKLCACCALVAASCASADLIDITGGVPLSDVIGNQFRVGDKLFNITTFSSPPNQFDPTQITIIPYQAGNPLAGRGFDLTGAFQDFVRGDASISEFNLQYTVEIVDDPNTPENEALTHFIVDNILTFNGNSGGNPGSFARVDESVFDFESGLLLGQKSVFDITRESDGMNEQQLQDMLLFAPIKKLEINKDVKFFASTTCCDASASFIRQSFSQIPTPGAGVLALTSGVVLLSRRRR